MRTFTCGRSIRQRFRAISNARVRRACLRRRLPGRRSGREPVRSHRGRFRLDTRDSDVEASRLVASRESDFAMTEAGTPRAGVAGWPVDHSRSPMIHHYWLKQLDLAGSYERFAVPPGEFRAFAAEIGQDGLVGANVTVPHKEAAFMACDRRTPVAEALGAVNTLWRQDGRSVGRQHGRRGLSRQYGRKRPGLGGPAEIGGGHWGRRRRSGDRLRIDVARLRAHRHRQPDANPGRRRWPRNSATPRGACRGPISPAELREADLLVNASSLGMAGQPPLEIDLGALRRRAVVADVVYAPLRTPLARGRRGATVCALWRGLACCCIRPCPHSSDGSASGPA